LILLFYLTKTLINLGKVTWIGVVPPANLSTMNPLSALPEQTRWVSGGGLVLIGKAVDLKFFQGFPDIS